MPTRWVHMLLALLAEVYSSRRDAQIRFLKLEVELLRAHIPGDRVILAPEERTRLLKLGAELDHRVHDLIGIVCVKTYQRWLREREAGQSPGRVAAPGR